MKLEGKEIRAYYASVERVRELENGNTEWRMAVTTSIGGIIPKFIVDSSMPKEIAAVRYDVF